MGHEGSDESSIRPGVICIDGQLRLIERTGEARTSQLSSAYLALDSGR